LNPLAGKMRATGQRAQHPGEQPAPQDSAPSRRWSDPSSHRARIVAAGGEKPNKSQSGLTMALRTMTSICGVRLDLEKTWVAPAALASSTSLGTKALV
jgi:hypothetical protein